LNADEIEVVVWEDIKAFCKNPQVAIEQLKALRIPDDDHLDERIEKIADQIGEVKRKEIRLLRIATESKELNIASLDALLAENRRSLEELQAYKSTLESDKLKADSFGDELVDVAERLAKLGDCIDQASYEERRKAIVVLVKEINIMSETIEGKIVSMVTITYKFNDPSSIGILSWPAVIPDRTPARAGTTVTRSNPAPAPTWW
jgi:hypothetical protein